MLFQVTGHRFRRIGSMSIPAGWLAEDFRITNTRLLERNTALLLFIYFIANWCKEEDKVIIKSIFDKYILKNCKFQKRNRDRKIYRIYHSHFDYEKVPKQDEQVNSLCL